MKNEPSSSNLTVVIGATGKTGRRVVDRLQASAVPVRAVARSTDPRFDWSDPQTWPAVLAGADCCFITFYPDLAFPGAVDTVEAFAANAADAGVRRLVLLPGRGEPEAQRAEVAVAGVGCEWTVVRASWFDQNFSEHFLLPSVLDGTITLPAASHIAEPFVDLDDVADVVAALTEDGHDGQVYEVTGPRLLTFGDVAEELTRATGRTITFESVSPEAFTDDALRNGVPAEEIEELVHLFVEILDGHNAYLTDGIQRALGRAPRDFADYAHDAASTGVWRETVSAAMTAATIVCLAASALMAGLFFGFSTFTMAGLRSIAPRDGLVAMQGINREAPRSVPFMAVFLGGALLAAVLGIIAATRLDDPAAPYELAGAILNVAGVVVTMGFHVPRNNALALLQPGGNGADRAWIDYARTWTRGNHVRTIGYLASTVLFAIALCRG